MTNEEDGVGFLAAYWHLFFDMLDVYEAAE